MGKQREEGRDGILGRRLVDLSLGVGTGRLHCQIDGQRLPGRGSGPWQNRRNKFAGETTGSQAGSEPPGFELQDQGGEEESCSSGRLT